MVTGWNLSPSFGTGQGVGATLALAVATLAALGPPVHLSAQDVEDPWAFQAEVGGIVFFGNQPQTQLTTKAEIEGTGSTVESVTRFELTYAESEDAAGVQVVNRRAWALDTTLDFRPGARWRPFLAGGVESSLERRIDRRYEAGVGARFAEGADRNNRLELSIAILGEQIRPREPLVEEETRARWSTMARMLRSFMEDRLVTEIRGEYEPVFDDFDVYTWAAQGSVTLSLTDVIGLRAGGKLKHDSEATLRGARTNRDGQVQLSIAVTL